MQRMLRKLYIKLIANLYHSLSQLYTGLIVTIRIGTSTREFKLSKRIISQQSAYFDAMFNGSFEEGKTQSVSLTEIEGVVSVRSFDMLVRKP
jgi:hypothetical protein